MVAINEIAAAENRWGAATFTALAKTLAQHKGDLLHAKAVADAGGRNMSPRVRDIIQKASPSEPGTLTSWGSEISDFKAVAGAFVASLARVSVYDAALPGMARVPLKTKLIAVVAAAEANEVGEATLKVNTELGLDAVTVEPRKFVSITAISSELLRAAGPTGEGFIGNELRAAVASVQDASFLSSLIGQSSPAEASTGNFATDLAALLSAIDVGADSKLFLIVSSSNMKAIAGSPSLNGGFAYPTLGPLGGDLPGVRILISNQIASDAVALFDAAGIAAGDLGVGLSIATQGDAIFDGQLISLWQKNLVGIKVERMTGWAVLRANAVASVSGADYSASSP